MGKRNYNILFHLHTVSGIVISVGLFVIFFAGSFSFFRDEIIAWERNETTTLDDEMLIDYDAALDTLSKTYNLYGREIGFIQYYNERRIAVDLSGSKDSLADEKGRESAYFYLDSKTFKTANYTDSYTLGEFLYRLHFFAQIPYPYGYYLSGFVALFFLFAIITGVIVHWDKIIKNFYLFRPKAKLKTIWTDAHTALGMIGLPFQFVYGVTGAFFMLSTLLIAPTVMALYNGDREKMFDELGYGEPTFVFVQKRMETPPNVNQFVAQTKLRWDGFRTKHVLVHNYGDSSMHVTVEGKLRHQAAFSGVGSISYHVSDREAVELKDPVTDHTYLDGVKTSMYQLHFGDYGGPGLKVVSFFLGITSCFVILSGVLIWLTARDRADVPESKRRFNERVVNVYMAICMSMLPVTACAFIFARLTNPIGLSGMYQFYFILWLVVSIGFILKKDNHFTTKYSLLAGGIIGLMIPVVTGFTSSWLWESIARQDHQLVIIDVLWIGISVVSILASSNMKRKVQKEERSIQKEEVVGELVV